MNGFSNQSSYCLISKASVTSEFLKSIITKSNLLIRGISRSLDANAKQNRLLIVRLSHRNNQKASFEAIKRIWLFRIPLAKNTFPC